MHTHKYTYTLQTHRGNSHIYTLLEIHIYTDTHIYRCTKKYILTGIHRNTLEYGSPREEIGNHSRILAWKIPLTEMPGGLQSMGSQRVGHDRVTEDTLHTPQNMGITTYINTFLRCTYRNTLRHTRTHIEMHNRGMHTDIDACTHMEAHTQKHQTSTRLN